MARGKYAHTRPRRAPSWPRRVGWAAAGLLVLAVAGILIGYELDGRNHRGRVLRQVSFAGQDVAGMTRAELDAVIARSAARIDAAPVEIDAPGGGFTTTAPALGLHVDTAATAKRVMQARRQGWPGARLWDWINSFFGVRRFSPVTAVDPGRISSALSAHDPGQRLPVEPEVKGDTAGFVVVPGQNGSAIDTAALTAALPRAVDRGLDPVRVSVPRRTLFPRTTYPEARRIATLAGQEVSLPLPVSAGSLSLKIPVPTLWSWVHSQPTPSGLKLVVDQAAANAGLAKLLAKGATAPVNTSFVVQGGAIAVATPGTPGETCCADGAGALIDKALFGGAFPTPQDPPLALPLVAVPPRVPADLVPKLGISQVIGTFTSSYDPATPRVTNIHHIADILRGWVMLPGDTLALNTVVGERTVANGFVAAQSIAAGHTLGTDVGGGISQFASALLNAAYVGGLDITAYSSPSLHDPNEPLGREASVSWPSPDLKVRDATPYGVVVWTSYTDTTVTVTLFSTGFATGAQTAQRVTMQGACQRVHTTRTRTYTDGRSTLDSLDAFYYPGPGLPC